MTRLGRFPEARVERIPVMKFVGFETDVRQKPLNSAQKATHFTVKFQQFFLDRP